MTDKDPRDALKELGGYIREQRRQAELSLRKLADLANVSNPYLSQIERGLKRPSAEITRSLSMPSLEKGRISGGVQVPSAIFILARPPALSSSRR